MVIYVGRKPNDRVYPAPDKNVYVMMIDIETGNLSAAAEATWDSSANALCSNFDLAILAGRLVASYSALKSQIQRMATYYGQRPLPQFINHDRVWGENYICNFVWNESIPAIPGVPASIPEIEACAQAAPGSSATTGFAVTIDRNGNKTMTSYSPDMYPTLMTACETYSKLVEKQVKKLNTYGCFMTFARVNTVQYDAWVPPMDPMPSFEPTLQSSNESTLRVATVDATRENLSPSNSSSSKLFLQSDYVSATTFLTWTDTNIPKLINTYIQSFYYVPCDAPGGKYCTFTRSWSSDMVYKTCPQGTFCRGGSAQPDSTNCNKDNYSCPGGTDHALQRTCKSVCKVAGLEFMVGCSTECGPYT